MADYASLVRLTGFSNHDSNEPMLSSDPFLVVLDRLLLIPAGISLAILLIELLGRRTLDFRRAVLLGFSLPVALIYIVVIGKTGAWFTEPLGEELESRFKKVVIFAPQVLLLFPIGIVVWVNVSDFQTKWRAGWFVVLLIVAMGHFWTRSLLSAI